MAKKTKMLTTSEFSQISGISVSTLNKWIRDGKITGQKQSGRWLIGEDQLKAKPVKEVGGSDRSKKVAGGKKKTVKAARKPPVSKKEPIKKEKPVKPPKKPAAGAKTFSVDEFSAMTYLTDFGVRKFLKNGQLKGEIDSEGTWRVFAENLLDPLIKHLVR